MDYYIWFHYKQSDKVTCLNKIWGRRRVILLGAADGVKESRELVEHFCNALQLWRVEQEMLVIGDAKMCNCFLVIPFHLNIIIEIKYLFPQGIGCHSSTYPCAYCTNARFSGRKKTTRYVSGLYKV